MTSNNVNEEMNAVKGKKIGHGKPRGNKIIYILGIPLIIVLGILLGGTIYYNYHFYPNTTIGSVDASNMTEKEAYAAIKKEIDDYSIAINARNDVSVNIDGSAIMMTPSSGEEVKKLLKEQTGIEFIKYLFEKNEIEEQSVDYNHELLEETLKSLDILHDENEIAPDNAYITYKDGEFVIVPENMGTTIEEEEFIKTVKEKISSVCDSINIEEEDLYVNPTRYSDDEGLNTAVKNLNEVLETNVQYEAGDRSYSLDREVIKDLYVMQKKNPDRVKVSKNGKVKLDSGKVDEVVNAVFNRFTTLYSERKAMTSYGKEVTLTRSDYGWKVDKEKEKKAILKALKKHTKETREPKYSNKAASHGKYEYGDTYVEINLTAQHLFVYKNGSKVYETDFVSGNESKDCGTRPGLYFIKYKEKDATLRGDDYATPVSYWMPFDGGIGLHDATWRSKFGGTIYKTAGSHGCVNLPPAAAKEIFSIVDSGEPVIVYKLSGTERHDNTDASGRIINND